MGNAPTSRDLLEVIADAAESFVGRFILFAAAVLLGNAIGAGTTDPDYISPKWIPAKAFSACGFLWGFLPLSLIIVAFYKSLFDEGSLLAWLLVVIAAAALICSTPEHFSLAHLALSGALALIAAVWFSFEDARGSAV